VWDGPFEADFFLGAVFEDVLTCFEFRFSFLYSSSDEIDEKEVRGD